MVILITIQGGALLSGVNVTGSSRRQPMRDQGL